VAKKIDRWHDAKSKNPEQFERDEEYIELDHSPTNFSSSGDEGGVDQISLEELGKRHIISKTQERS
jgi:hypothetical protein